MKKIFLCIILCAFISCDHQSESENPTPRAENHSRFHNHPAGNALNPYDFAGQIHDELFVSYFTTPCLTFSVDSVANKINALAEKSASFHLLEGSSQPRNTAASIGALAGHELCGVTDAIANSNLSTAGKNSLSTFTSTLLFLYESEADYTLIHSFITLYEEEVTSNSLLSGYDRKRILTLTSVLRYSAHRGKKKPKKNTDPDWNHLIFNLAGGLEGGERTAAESVVNALTGGIVQNHNP